MRLPVIMETADTLRIDLLMDEVASIEEAISAIENLPEDVDAIYRIPSPTLESGSSKIGLSVPSEILVQPKSVVR